jgi:hypothetical protein
MKRARPARFLVAAALGAALLAAPARAHDDPRAHLHVNGTPVYVEDGATAPAWLQRVPAPLFGIAGLAVAATLLRRRRRTAPRAA